MAAGNHPIKKMSFVSRGRVLVRSADAWLGVSLLGFAAIAWRDLAGWDPGRALYELPGLYVASDTTPHLIFALSAYFVWRRRAAIARAFLDRRGNPAGWMLVAPATALFSWSIYTGSTDLSVLALIPVLLGGALVIGGGALARALLLPALFLVFSIPMPAVLANQLVWAFQQGTTELTRAVLEVLGSQPLQEGEMLYVRGRAFEVIESCSGLRLTETLVMSSLVYAEVMGTRRAHAIVIVGMAPALAFLLNTVRVLSIIFDPSSDVAADHTLQGIGVLVAGVLSFALLEWLLGRVMTGPTSTQQVSGGPPGRRSGRAPLAIFAATLLALATISVALPRWEWREGRPPWDFVLPSKIDGWSARMLEPESQFLGSVSHIQQLNFRYEGDGVYTDVFIGSNDRLDRDRSIFSAKNAIPGAGWEVIERRQRPTRFGLGEVEEIVAVSRGRRVLSVHWYQGDLGFARELFRALLALDRSPFHLREPAWVVRVTTPLGRGPGARMAADDRIDHFAGLVRDTMAGG